MIISDPIVAKDLFQVSGAIFSSRAESYIKGQHVFKLRGITANPYNDRWSVLPNLDQEDRNFAYCTTTGASIAAFLRIGSVSVQSIAILMFLIAKQKQ